MKSAAILLLISAFICLAFSLQLSSNREKNQSDDHHLKNRSESYYPKHYLGYRSQHYTQMIIEKNKKKIEQFNEKNKNKCKSTGVPGQVKGGHSFVEEANKFIGFTQEEVIQLFTGLKEPETNHAHHKAQSIQVHKESGNSNSHQLFDNHILKKVGASNHFLQMQNHDSRVHMENEEHDWEGREHDASWTYKDPSLIDDSDLQNLYGDVNSDDNVGWDWKSTDPNYYKAPPVSSNFDTYWQDWQKDHWGSDENSSTSVSEVSASGNLPWDSSSSGWWTTFWGKKPNNPDDEPSGPVQPDDLDDSDSPSDDDSTNPGTNPIAPYPTNSMDVNWVIKGATTHVKEQGQCGSCWTFGVNGLIESYLLIKGRGKVDLSEQQLVDCQRVSFGCKGGYMHQGLNYATKNGLVTEEKYPYKAAQHNCAHPSGPFKIPKYKQVQGRVEMEQALRKGPLAGVVHANHDFIYYKQGIFDRCISKTENHAIVIVGFTKDYWIARNSWGTNWGEKGHIRIKRNQNNNNACEIQKYAYALE